MFNLSGVSGAELAEQQIILWLVRQQAGQQQELGLQREAARQVREGTPAPDLPELGRPSGSASSSDWMPSGQPRNSLTPELDYLAELGEAEGKDRQVLRQLSEAV